MIAFIILVHFLISFWGVPGVIKIIKAIWNIKRINNIREIINNKYYNVGASR